jgi:hypothetical protein
MSIDRIPYGNLYEHGLAAVLACYQELRAARKVRRIDAHSSQGSLNSGAVERVVGADERTIVIRRNLNTLGELLPRVKPNKPTSTTDIWAWAVERGLDGVLKDVVRIQVPAS